LLGTVGYGDLMIGPGPGADSTASAGLSIAVLGDDDALREAAAALLGKSGFSVPAEMREVGDFHAHPVGSEPDCVVVLDAENAASVAAIREVRREFPASAIVCVTESAARRSVFDKLDAGADGIVLLDTLERQLSSAVFAVCSGQLSLPGEFRTVFGKPRLSPREKQVLSMVVLGFTNREIANKLYLAESTIKSHLSSAFEKLGVRSRSEAVALILDSKNGLGTGILSILEEETAIASAAP
jgi:DNA-binding NarL/FixJ family response regulator